MKMKKVVSRIFYIALICTILVYTYMSTTKTSYIEEESPTKNIKFILDKHSMSTIKKSNVEEEEPLKKDKKFILYWHPMFGQKDFNLGLGDVFGECPYSNCYTTANKTYLPVEEFDAILFHGIEYNKDSQGFPQKRLPHQLYVVSMQESPVNTPSRLKNTNNFYNWTMTYRTDSDILRTYGMVIKNKTNYELPTEKEILSKTSDIAWFVSHCTTQSRRERLAKELKNYIPVDIYGSCGEFKCPRSKNDECLLQIEKQYKFYLSFENSYCEDYVTEKLFLYLHFNIIPIVYGNADYKLLTPENSVINVNDFNSVKDLATYLKFLIDNPKEYLKYFEWKKHYFVDQSSKFTLCSLCEKLNKPLIKKTYSDIYTWWNGDNDSKCTLPKLIESLDNY